MWWGWGVRPPSVYAVVSCTYALRYVPPPSPFPKLYEKGGGEAGSSASVLTKEYILVIEGTAAPCILQTYDSPNLSPLCLQYTPTT